jgi:Protein of unknown function (DUF2752)
MGILAVALRLFPPDTSAFYPTCPFHALTGLLCPVCGFTRALAALVAGRWQEAVHANPLVAIGAPVLAFRILWAEKPGHTVIPAAAMRYILAIAFAFTIVRNLVG